MESVCGRCSENLFGSHESCDFARCGKCNRAFHFQCCSVTEQSYRLLALEKRKLFKCSECLADLVNKPQTDTARKAVCESVKTHNTKAQVKPITTGDIGEQSVKGEGGGARGTSTGDMAVEVCDLMRRIDFLCAAVTEIKTSSSELHAEVKAVNTSMSRIDKRFEVMTTALDEMRAIQDGLLKSNQQLLEENSNLKAELCQCKLELDSVQQYSRNNNIELRGLPETEGEDCIQIITNLSSVVGVKLEESALDVAHRVNTSDNRRAANIVAKFVRRVDRDNFITACRKQRLTSRDINKDLPQVNIFVNEHLTPYRKALFSSALQLKREHGWSFLWTRNGVILARKSVGCKVTVIRTTEDLRHII